jgi:hypothetical protein
MSETIIKLGDDWHNPHPYERLIRSIFPKSSYDDMQDIENCLLRVYEAQHYDFKIYKDKSKATVYDLDISQAEGRIHSLEVEKKRDEEAFERLCKKLEETIQEQRKHGFLREEATLEEAVEEEEDEMSAYEMTKDVQVSKDPKKINKEEVRKRRELEARLSTTVKSTQSSMATTQQKLMDYQKEIEILEKKKEYFEHYRTAALWYQAAMRKIVLDYEVNKDVEVLVKGINDVLSYYNTIRRRNVSSDPCKGRTNEPCESHFLPLTPVKYSEKGEAIDWRCDLYATSSV